MKSLWMAGWGALAAGAAGTMAGASGGSISEAYSFSFVGPTSYTTFFGGAVTEDNARLNGDRQDAPGPGVDATIPDLFTAYCVEENTLIRNPGSHKVLPLLGSTTDVGGADLPGPSVTFDAVRTDRMQRFWGTFIGAVNDVNTSSAFQIAVFEIAYDTDLTLAAPGPFFVGAGQFQPGITDLAESWLSVIRAGGGVSQELFLLTGPGNQDVITTPAPGAAALLGAAGAAALRRRRR